MFYKHTKLFYFCRASRRLSHWSSRWCVVCGKSRDFPVCRSVPRRVHTRARLLVSALGTPLNVEICVCKCQILTSKVHSRNERIKIFIKAVDP